MKKQTLIYFYIFTLCTLPSISAVPSTIVLGTEDGWTDFITINGIQFTEGKNGYVDVVLEDGQYASGSTTELLLHFNTPYADAAPLYINNTAPPEITAKIKRLGYGSAVFQKNNRFLSLSPKAESMFAPGMSWGDFSIEFWLYPATLDEGDTILLWKGSRLASQRILPQEVRCSISDRKLKWSFENVFLPPDHSSRTVVLSGRRGLIPRTWHHHLLRYDSGTGLLEYLIDGVPEYVTHSTETGREDGKPFDLVTGDTLSENLQIGSSLNGLLDELRISREFISDPFTDVFTQNTGTAMTKVYDLEYNNSLLSRISAEIEIPGNTGIHFYYRLGEAFRSMSEVVAEWIPFIPGENFPGSTRGRYLQILVELFPDGEGNLTPTLSSLQVDFIPDLPPHPPAWVRIDSQNEALAVNWQASTDSDVSGYLVYYGNKPRQYFGSGANLGPSPIDVGADVQVSLDGLTNGKLYYVAVAAYDSSDPPHKSEFSKEVAARPSNIHQREP
ncbi:MAG: hypothetical protein HN368_08485 [Spirochaetales bacterium]|jgi:hypothetical protein|nr:hypothetical protein [Spirochaetales bacterium]